MQTNPVVSLPDGHDPERLHIKHRHSEIGSIADIKREAPDRQGVGERRDRQVDVVATIEVVRLIKCSSLKLQRTHLQGNIGCG